MPTVKANEISGIGDPFIINAKNDKNARKYYLYATSAGDGFKCWSSDNLEDWEPLGYAFKRSENHWGENCYWAPEVIFHNGKYIIHYTARWSENHSLRIGVATSDTPYGPFTDIENAPMFDFGYAAIDAHVFINDDGNAYMYYSRDCSEYIYEGCHESHIYMVRLTSDLLKTTGEPVLIAKPEKEFERKNADSGWFWNEGAYVVKKAGKYLLTYSANCYASFEYCICLASSDYPEGPFIKNEANPMLAGKKDESGTPVLSGPGHHAFFYGEDGRMYVTYHIHTDPLKPSGNRRVQIKKCCLETDRFIIEDL